MAGLNGHSNGKATKNGKVKLPHGRPSLYSQAIADEICRRIASGESLRAVCESHKDDAKWPDDSTVRGWFLEDREGFSKHYARAQRERAERWAEEITEIADDGSNDWMERFDSEGKSIGWSLNGEHVQRSRLRVDTRKWLLSKVLPKVYGDKVDVEHSGGVQVLHFNIMESTPESARITDAGEDD